MTRQRAGFQHESAGERNARRPNGGRGRGVCWGAPGREYLPPPSGRGSDRGRNLSSDADREIRSTRGLAANRGTVLRCRRLPHPRLGLSRLVPAPPHRVGGGSVPWCGTGLPHIRHLERLGLRPFGLEPRTGVLAINEAFEGHPLERIAITTTLSDFCKEHSHRMPDQYWSDPLPRARDYLTRHEPPWYESP